MEVALAGLYRGVSMHFDAIKLSVLIFCFLGIFCEPAFASGELSPIQISPVSIGGAASSKTSLVPLSKNLDVRVAAVLHACREFWLKYRADVRRISEVSEQVRNEGFVQYFGFVFFLVFMFREKIYSIRSFFNKMMEKNPLPAYRKGGIKDEYIVRVRKILFYFCIYFIYQIIQYPLSFGSHSQVAFFADLMFQSVIVTLLLVEYFRLKRSVSKRWRGDPDRHEK